MCGGQLISNRDVFGCRLKKQAIQYSTQTKFFRQNSSDIFPPQMIDYSTALPETPDTYFPLSYLPAVMNITTSDVAPTTTYSSQSGQPH